MKNFIVYKFLKFIAILELLPLNVFMPYFVAIFVFLGMKFSSKLSKNSTETSAKRFKFPAIVLRFVFVLLLVVYHE